ncbi:hypothetical protein ACLK2E_21695 [Escherichia coli]
MSNRIKRKTLDEAEIARECAAIREMGFEHLLLVTGEHRAKSAWTTFVNICPRFATSSPRCIWKSSRWRMEEYAELKTLGLDGVMVYQETYHESMYAKHHLKGKSRTSSGGWIRRTGLGRRGLIKLDLARLAFPTAGGWTALWWRSICCGSSSITGAAATPSPSHDCGLARGE